MSLKEKIEKRLDYLVVEIKKGQEELVKELQNIKDPTKLQSISKGMMIKSMISLELVFVELSNLLDNNLENCSAEAQEYHKGLQEGLKKMKDHPNSDEIPQELKDFLNRKNGN